MAESTEDSMVSPTVLPNQRAVTAAFVEIHRQTAVTAQPKCTCLIQMLILQPKFYNFCNSVKITFL